MFSPDAAASFLVFTALYAPCVAAQAAMRQELGSRLGSACSSDGLMRGRHGAPRQSSTASLILAMKKQQASGFGSLLFLPF
ncbi:MAG: hypothetical protein ACLUNO_01355 [Oscillospiraceae bacterium]